MNLLNKILNHKNLKIKLFFFFSFIVTWLSISSSYQHLLIFSSNEEITISKIINFFRIGLMIFIFPILSFLFIKKLTKINSSQLKKNILIYSVFLYFLSQIPGLFYTPNSIENFIYILSAINFLMILSLCIKTLRYDEILILIYLVFIILFSIFTYTFSMDLLSFLEVDEYSKKFYGSLNTILEDNYIRSSGTSRIALVLLIIYLTILKRYITSLTLK